MDPRANKDWFHGYFRDEDNLENFENTSEINP